ncbi:CGNR zinc finger domain-containing protein [Streptomyces sp. DSM 44915]|uniref:CGNR zinc finger domain-containing protein n=1 Tax=Streptomyces chisholmiae TaxID=3075540 RepID=A0ABU2JKX5_9ACTN|nr:CGNR zinc finger domain-containing protein [Streptomyces sp. DSM 44915]MDT0265631.1 CGNR zinc finger domain-containing protein [Streptomyces sp. DSM 44915]
MELTYYSDYAVRLVNTEQPLRHTDTLTSVAAVRALFGEAQQAARRATDADVTRLRGVRARLRAVFTAAAEGDESSAVDLLNALLLEYPASPQISGHDFLDEAGRPRWHLHLAEHPSNATAGYAATACMGLAVQLTDLGVDRLGICEATPCRNAYIDTSTNRSRRYCSDRCATRANVAAYRARKRRERAVSGRTAPGNLPTAPANATTRAPEPDLDRPPADGSGAAASPAGPSTPAG